MILVFVAMPLKYFFGQPLLVAVVGMAHGFLYMAYIVVTLLLAERCRWRPFDALVILAVRHDPAGVVLRRAARHGAGARTPLPVRPRGLTRQASAVP